MKPFTLWVKSLNIPDLCVNPYAPTFTDYDEIYTSDYRIAAGVCRTLNNIYMGGEVYKPNK